MLRSPTSRVPALGTRRVTAAMRAKIDKGFDHKLLQTVRGVGYVLDDKPR